MDDSMRRRIGHLIVFELVAWWRDPTTIDMPPREATYATLFRVLLPTQNFAWHLTCHMSGEKP